MADGGFVLCLLSPGDPLLSLSFCFIHRWSCPFILCPSSGPVRMRRHTPARGRRCVCVTDNQLDRRNFRHASSLVLGLGSNLGGPWGPLLKQRVFPESAHLILVWGPHQDPGAGVLSRQGGFGPWFWGPRGQPCTVWEGEGSLHSSAQALLGSRGRWPGHGGLDAAQSPGRAAGSLT